MAATRHPAEGKTHGQLGLSPGRVLLVEHSPAWQDMFEREKSDILAAIGHSVIQLEHVGSTAIPGLMSKPVLDMLLGIAELAAGPTLLEGLQPLGYRYLAKQVVQNHHVFGKGVALSHLLHIVEHDGPEWRRLLGFRHILLSRPEVARHYEETKINLSRRHASDRDAYALAKEPLIDRILIEHGMVDIVPHSASPGRSALHREGA